MKKEIRNTYESLSAEEKQRLHKHKKKGITKITQSINQETGEIISTETTYNSNDRREKGTFYQGDPEELIKFIHTFFRRKEEKIIFEYIISNINYANEFSFDKKWLNTNFPNINKFYTYRKKLENLKYIFKTTRKNIYTLNVQFFNRMTQKKAFELYKIQFGENFDKNINAFINISKMAQTLNKTELRELIKQLENHLKQ